MATTNKGFLDLMPAEEVAKRQEDKVLGEQDNDTADFTTKLASYVDVTFERYKRDKEERIENIMLDCVRRRRSKYPADLLAKYKEIGSFVFIPMTEDKCNAAEAIMVDSINQKGTRSWKIEPTPVPDLDPDNEKALYQIVQERVMQSAYDMVMETGQEVPPEVTAKAVVSMMEKTKYKVEKMRKEAAKKKMNKMADVIDDQLTEGGYYVEIVKFLNDLTTYPAAFFKGPIFRNKKKIKYVQSNNRWEPEVKEEVTIEFERVNPFDIYTDPNATNIQDSDIIQFHSYKPSNLIELIGVDGYKEEAIRKVLSLHRQKGLHKFRNHDYQRTQLENKSTMSINESIDIDALEFWGSIPGSMLMEWDIGQELDSEMEYQATVILVGTEVIFAMLNTDPIGRKPYYSTSFEIDPDSLHGMALPLRLAAAQDIINSTGRALNNNVAIASGPQVVIDIDMMHEATHPRMFPWKQWFIMNQGSMPNKKPVEFYSPPFIADKLITIYNQFKQQADEVIPPYSYGSDQAGGAGGTASGLSMLMTSSSRTIKLVLFHVYANVINPLITNMYEHNMLNHPEDSIKGDAQVAPEGIFSMIAKEQLAIRRQEYLASVNNPVDNQIIGLKGRATLHREIAKTLDMDVDAIIPPDQEIDEIITAMEAKAVGENGGLPDEQLGNPQPGIPQEESPVTIDSAGNPAGGTDFNLFQDRGEQ